MSEKPTCNSCKAKTMKYDDEQKKWISLGSTSEMSDVRIYRDITKNTFRVIGRNQPDAEVVIDYKIDPKLNYNKPTATFHQWKDERNTVYGLEFSNPDEAKHFATAIEIAVNILNGGKDRNIPRQRKVVKITTEVQSENGTSKITIDLPVLKKIFDQYDKYLVAVYTISGPLRTGKSFLQSLLVSYLRVLEVGQCDRTYVPSLGTEQDAIRKMFDFHPGSEPLTKGIHMLDKPFLINVVEEGVKKQVALFLADTQGLFDENKASESDLATMGSLNFLLSSRQYINVKERIDQIQLDYLCKFSDKVRDIEKGNKIKENASPFQKESLMFIVRDWHCDSENGDYSYGLKGGEEYFKNITTPTTKETEEHNLKQQNLLETFGEIPCFLLPDPGKGVENNEVILKDVSKDFRSHTLDFFDFLVNPKKVIIKEVGGKKMTCGELYRYMEVLSSALNYDASLENTETLKMLTYGSQMHNITSNYARAFVDEIQNCEKKTAAEFDSLEKEVLEKYTKEPKYGDEAYIEEWTIDLKHLLSQIKSGFLSCAIAEKEYLQAIANFRIWVKNNATARKVKEEVFEEDAEKKIEELREDLKTKISEDIYMQCVDYFNNQVQKILQETKKEMNKVQEDLDSSRWYVNLFSGITLPLPIVPGIIYWVGHKAIDYRENRPGRGKGLSNTPSSDEASLLKYTQGSVAVKLCFGVVNIRVERKLKLPTQEVSTSVKENSEKEPC